jgi:cytochrome c-type biogenesis protein CcmE
MSHRYIKIGITAVVLLLAFGGLLWSTLRDGTEYFQDVKEVMQDRQAWEGKRFRLHGYVVPGSIYRGRDSLEYRFKVQNDPPRSAEGASATQIVEVTYTGVVPDTFKGEADVTLRGRLTSEGFQTEPNGIIAKCPSKYEAVGPSKSASTGS